MTDYHAQGQHDREDSREDSLLDLILHGGQSPHYSPPDDKDDHAEYKSGWDNAERK